MSALSKINDACEKVVFESRWLLFPFLLGLILALCVYEVRFLHDTYTFVRVSMYADIEDVMVQLLGLVDACMVGNLLIMIVSGSYQIFIHKFELDANKRPGWLDHIDTGLLKVKTSQSIASITGVALLKDFVNLERLGWLLVEHRLIVHGVCLVSALVMAVIWRVTHTDDKHAGAHPENTAHTAEIEAAKADHFTGSTVHTI